MLPDWLAAVLVSGAVQGLVTWGGVAVTLRWHKTRLDGHDVRLNMHAARIRAMELSMVGRRRLLTDLTLSGDPGEGEPET